MGSALAEDAMAFRAACTMAADAYELLLLPLSPLPAWRSSHSMLELTIILPQFVFMVVCPQLCVILVCPELCVYGCVSTAVYHNRMSTSTILFAKSQVTCRNMHTQGVQLVTHVQQRQTEVCLHWQSLITQLKIKLCNLMVQQCKTTRQACVACYSESVWAYTTDVTATACFVYGVLRQTEVSHRVGTEAATAVSAVAAHGVCTQTATTVSADTVVTQQTCPTDLPWRMQS